MTEWSPNRILAIREALGWTQLEMAVRLRCDPMTVSRWERGLNHPSYWLERQLARLESVALRQDPAGPEAGGKSH
jgi:transcriptional regulator with XRE-family HTH domain